MKRLSPESPVFLEQIEKEKQSDSSHLFGLECVQKIAQLEDQSTENIEIESVLQKSIELLKEMKKTREKTFATREFKEFIIEATGDPEIAGELKAVYPDVNDTEFIFDNLSAIPLTLYRRILERHISCYQEKDLEFQRQLPELQEEFLRRFNKQIDELNLPISQERISQRLEKLKVVAGDFLLYSDFGRSGGYNPESFVVTVSAGNALSSNYTHEMLHAMSGMFITDGEKIEVVRTGVSVKESLQWLNEALTQFLEVKLTGQESPYYREERKIFELLVKGGVPQSLFFQVYFEDQQIEGNDKKSSLKNLIKAINEKFGEQFLQKLDKIIKEKGPKEGLKEIEKYGTS